MEFSTHSISSTQRAEFEEIANERELESGYKWLSSSEIPSAIPVSLRSKMTSALLMWQRTSSGAVYLVCNGIRRDDKDNALDQEPFGIAVHSSGASPSGIFIHHGDWHDRTTPITLEVVQVIDSTSLGNYFPLGGVPAGSSGPLSDLEETSHEGAFRTVLKQLARSP